MLADVTMNWSPGADEVSLTFAPAGLIVVAPLPGDRYRIVATVDDAPATPDAEFVQRLLDQRAPGRATVTGLVWSSRFRVHHRFADRFRQDRLFLAGDAAHVHSPAGGQGMKHRDPGRVRAGPGAGHRAARRLRRPAPAGR